MKHRTLITRLLLCLILLEPASKLLLTFANAQSVHAIKASPATRFADGYYVSDDFTSAEVNTRNGARVTTHQPMNSIHTLWLFGNSVAYGLFVPDDDTIASRLQSLFPHWRIVNQSTSGQSVRGQVAWLKQTPIKPGDIVVFVDGFTESYFVTRKSIPVDPALIAECDKPQEQRAIVTAYAVACGMLPMFGHDQAVLNAAVADYAQSLAEAKRVTEAQGVSFYHFLQPGVRAKFPVIGHDLAKLRGTIVVEVPSQDYIDSNLHVNRHGAILVAHAIFNELTVF